MKKKICALSMGNQLKPLGKKVVTSTEIEYIPAEMKLIHIYKETWECQFLL